MHQPSEDLRSLSLLLLVLLFVMSLYTHMPWLTCEGQRTTSVVGLFFTLRSVSFTPFPHPNVYARLVGTWASRDSFLFCLLSGCRITGVTDGHYLTWLSNLVYTASVFPTQASVLFWLDLLSVKYSQLACLFFEKVQLRYRFLW